MYTFPTLDGVRVQLVGFKFTLDAVPFAGLVCLFASLKRRAFAEFMYFFDDVRQRFSTETGFEVFIHLKSKTKTWHSHKRLNTSQIGANR